MAALIDDDAKVGRLVLLLVGVAAVAVYLTSLPNGFAYDDVTVIQHRELLHHLGRLPDILSAQYWPEELGAGLYRPLTLLTYALDWTLWGGAPFGFHLVNVLLHAAVSLLVALLLLRFFPWWGALAGGLVFAIHPVHTEAVANVVGRAELLTAGFALGACLIYVDASKRERIGARHVAPIGLLYVCAMLSKELGVVLPALLLLLDLPLRKLGNVDKLGRYLRRRAALILTLGVLLVAYLVVRWAVLGAIVGAPPDRAFAPDESFPTRLFTMARVWPRYFELLLFPTHLSADYSPPVILPAERLTWAGGLGFALVAGTLALALAAWRRAPELTAAVGWAVVALLPVSNLLFAGQFVLAERTLYLPSVALSVAAALLLSRAPSTRKRHVAVALGAWVVGFSFVTVRQNPVWEASHTVWDHVRRVHPESSKLVWGLGVQSLRKGDWPEARRLFRSSLQLWPYHEPYLVEFAYHLMEHEEFEAAERYAAAASEASPTRSDYLLLLAHVRWKGGDPANALRTIERALTLGGEEGSLYLLRADIEAGLGDSAAAAEAQRRSIESTEGEVQAEAWLRLARFRAAAGDTTGALAALDSSRQGANASRAAADSLLWNLRSEDREEVGPSSNR